ncbi:MAG TPA: tetratricopeptide repeat protein, partial [Alphaproteobacteria bacterium]|nr:tetratricopeptide repeat protein [Alphaproteobacteria bacterium]
DADLKAALAFRPNHPYLLNYLGYSWADQGINLEEALDMIKEAAMSKPEDGYIADSLGWVYYKMNDFEAAIPHLEQAVELLPYDATINDHLGDAYWRVGRKMEARFQWRRAANYSEDDEGKLKKEIEEKIVSGLPDLPKNPKTMTGAIIEEIKDKTKPSL